jgi:XisH protein
MGASTMTEFHVAIGQYTNYRYALEDLQYEHTLYLAVPVTIYNDFFNDKFVQSVIQRSQVNLIIYDEEKEEVVKWQK